MIGSHVYPCQESSLLMLMVLGTKPPEFISPFVRFGNDYPLY